MLRNAREEVGCLSGDDLSHLMAAATQCLERNVEAINALNVFPVPDGDTGINMLLTMRTVQEHLATLDSAAPVSHVAQTVARGALLGARGNSGVILSQFFRGLASALSQCTECDEGDLIRGFQLASQAAYKAVGKPVEGTMLTVIREAAEAVKRHGSEATGLLSLWDVACRAATEALARTPQQLPVLREAGVVDAGGQGMVAILEGAGAFLRGDEVGELNITLPAEGAGAAAVSQEFLSATEEELYGYCTQFMVEGQALDIESIRDHMAAMADSAVVVGDEKLLKVHVHTFDPAPIMSYAGSLGAVSQVHIDNIDEQHQKFVASHRGEQEVSLAVVAVAWGSGLENLFRNLGAASVVLGGQSMNPSTQELLDALQSVAAREVILFPNNPNIIAAANQAASLAQKVIKVVPTSTIPQGIAALLAFNPERDAEANLSAMAEAVAGVRTGQITTAVRSTNVRSLKVRQGQIIGFLEEKMVAVGDEVAGVVHQVLDRAKVNPENLVTLYWGGLLDQAQAEGIEEQLRDAFPETEIELVLGGQPHYHFILSIE